MTAARVGLRHWSERPFIQAMVFRAVLFLSLLGSVSFAQKPDEQKSRLVFPPAAQSGVPAEATPTPASKVEEPLAVVQKFFLAIKANQVEAAYEGLVRGTIIAEKQENVNDLKARTMQALDSYGAVAGFEVVDTMEVGQSLLRYTCISLNQDLPLRWRFYFYRTPPGWKLVDLRVDDGLVELFEDASRTRKK